ncbi:RhoGAP-domain-containing protein [Trichodelitschia bisporula]|uniref:RhoGAP-domain-containing protein n=1 Tax=Trichodelitschia bisporula TaxID=703511 RepID=A0A6G1HWW4_9PEZI|nr:RhoGAP-domain-containing protein [Trichodelitschia bisporula]
MNNRSLYTTSPPPGQGSAPPPGPYDRDPAEREWVRQNSFPPERQNSFPLDRQNAGSSNNLPSSLVPGTERPKASTPNSGSRRPSGSRICGKCEKPLQGQFVRALDNTYHLDCFTCHECGTIVASKFFPVPDEGPNQYPLCEKDYFKRLDLLCAKCGGALRGSYITALERKYHIEHFTCSVCPTIFGAQDSYYEHEGSVYCHYHYSTRFAQRCHGCHNAILKQFVEIFRNGENQHWHPECYMIHKYWNVRLHNTEKDRPPQLPSDDLSEADATEEIRTIVRQEEERVESKVIWIWQTLSNFEEKSATCISDMLINVSNGGYFDGICAARRFIVHVDVFFQCTDELDRLLSTQTSKGLAYSREAKLLCKKVVAFFALLAASSESGSQRLGVTQDLLGLVTGLAHYLKLLIRICLQGALRLERETGSTEGLNQFLKRIDTLEKRLDDLEATNHVADSAPYVSGEADHCPLCQKPVEDKCLKASGRYFHLTCMVCSSCGRDVSETYQEAFWSPNIRKSFCRDHVGQAPDAQGGFVYITRLQQYVHLLLVAHARLLATLRHANTLPHTDDNIRPSGNDGGQTLSPTSGEPNMLRSESRSKSYAGTGAADNRRLSASYEQALGDIRRLRSTRLERHLSNTSKRPRASIIREGGTGLTDRSQQEPMPEADDESHVSFGAQSMALDDIPRLVQAEQAKDQRPNAARYARGHLVAQDPKVKLLNGHRRDFSDGPDVDHRMREHGSRPKKYFSELSALEYFIVRHIAVFSMEPLLDNQFTQQELLDLIETKKSPTFWDRFGKAFKNEKGGNKKKGIFGKSLEYVVERDGAESTDGVGPGTLRIPAIVENAVSAMRNMDMSVEGVFRKNGNIRRLKELAEEIDTKGSEGVDLTRETAVQVAALLKKFLRELPDPILTYKLHHLFILAAKIPDEDKRRRVLHLTCCLLPKVHRDTMEVLFSFLNWVSSFHTVDEETGSKMDIHNLATVIAPNILHSGNKNNPDMDLSFLAIEAIHCLIECNESMCEVPEDLLSIVSETALLDNNDITTKEIVKKFGDLAKVPQPTIQSPDGHRPQRSREGRSTGVMHAADPHAWQNETSARHMGYGPPQGMGGPKPMGTPPPNFSQPHNFSQPSPNRHSQFRSPGIQKQDSLGIS